MISLKRLYEYKEEPSELDASIKMIITKKGDPIYKKIKHIFSKHGEAFIDIDSRIIYIDGEEAEREGWSNDHFLFVQAHEIAHLRMGHTPENRDETMADWWAVCYLWDKGYKDSAKLGIKQFEYRNGVKFNEYNASMIDEQ
mgnify:CR=1 FL=1|tara:strand:- start:709 stop:1131 length:423 start_codon:yes stop_codon:yes gene_type:complete